MASGTARSKSIRHLSILKERSLIIDLKQIIKNIFAILSPQQKRKFFKLIFFDVIMSILDISFLVLLLYVIHFYTQPHHSIKHLSFPLNIFDKYPLLLITLFFFLFCVKNLFGFLVFRMQYRYVYGVASRISKNNLLNYLEGSFSDYINIDSSCAYPENSSTTYRIQSLRIKRGSANYQPVNINIANNHSYTHL